MKRRIIVMFHFSKEFSEDEAFDLLESGDALGCFFDMFDNGSVHDSLSFHGITAPRPVSEKRCRKFLDETIALLKHQKDNPVKINNACRDFFEFSEPCKDKIEILRDRIASAQRVMDDGLPSDASKAYAKVLNALGLGTETGVVVLLTEIEKGDEKDTLTYYPVVTSLKGMLVDPSVSLQGYFFLFGALRANDIELADVSEDEEDDFDFKYVDEKEKPKNKGKVVYLSDTKKKENHS